MTEPIKNIAIKTIELESQSIAGLAEKITASFEEAVLAIHNCTGRVVISGIGKSAIIAQKIVASLNSTGTPSIFMHATDALHGDLGMVQQNDIVIIISKSGESPEIRILIPLIKNFRNLLIGIVGNLDSLLARQSDIVLDTTVEQEACPNNLAPTSSTTAQLVMGDALVICLMELKGFQSDDFAKFHPGGTLGKKLYLKVSDLYIQNEAPKITVSQGLKEVIVEITKKRLGATAVVDDANEIVGIITDGDLRRMLNNVESLFPSITAGQIMSKTPKTIAPDEMAVDALEKMRKNEISQLIVTENNKYLGMVHIHDLIREGLI